MGNTFDSIKQMCVYWNIPYGAYKERAKHNWSIERRLTTPIRKQQNIQTTDRNLGIPKSIQTTQERNVPIDHLGNKFPSIQKMCDYWGISYATYMSRRNQSGWSVKDALTTKTRTIKHPVTDHQGNQFASIKEACETWGIHRDTYTERIHYNRTDENEYFTKPVKPQEYKLGETFIRKYHKHLEYHQKTEEGIRRCAELEWETHHGKIPKNHSLIFLNGDPMDYRIENLECVSLSVRSAFNAERSKFSKTDSRKLALKMANLNSLINQINTKMAEKR